MYEQFFNEADEVLENISELALNLPLYGKRGRLREVFAGKGKGMTNLVTAIQGLETTGMFIKELEEMLNDICANPTGDGSDSIELRDIRKRQNESFKKWRDGTTVGYKELPEEVKE